MHLSYEQNLAVVPTESHNKRLKFLGDAVIQFLATLHLYHLFPKFDEGDLTDHRAEIIQKKHLALLADKNLRVYALGSNLEKRRVNCFKAFAGALFINSGIPAADKVFSNRIFMGWKEHVLYNWIHYPPDPLQLLEVGGDRHSIPTNAADLQKMVEFEESTGVIFNHVHLLARAFTHRSSGNVLTLESNQRLEFLCDSLLQLFVSEYVYKLFPEHPTGAHELRSALVNNEALAVVCDGDEFFVHVSSTSSPNNY